MSTIDASEIQFPARLSLSQTPTPFYCLEQLSANLDGPRIWVKRDDLTECAASGNKIRKLEFVLARAREAGCNVIITSGGLQSNHCRATALLCARLGLRVHLLLRDEGDDSAVPDGNLMLDYLAGAEVSIYPRQQFLREQADLVDHWRQHYENEGLKPWVIPVGASDGHGVWGYVRCAQELAADFDRAGIAPRRVFHATGSGGTQAGLTVGTAAYCPGVTVTGFAVCDDERYFLDKVRSDLRHWKSLYSLSVDVESLTISVNDRYVGPGYGVANDDVYATIRYVAAMEGLILDPVYSGKAFHGLLEEILAGRWEGEDDIVFVHTGGIFGLMAQRPELGFRRPPR
ncbi:MAG: D-cysteine desulfhydrase [Porticoccaceae bacterium]|nr:D-cysteine desulfhydrase [Porticoccaceae bacterium]